MFQPELKLGVELELEIEGDPQPRAHYISKHPIFTSRNKYAPAGNDHPKHGNILRAVELAGRDKVAIGYDGTLSDGIEIVGKPMSLAENKETWLAILLDPEVIPYVNGTWGQTGMHVHVSGDPITCLTLAKMYKFINAPVNRADMAVIAGRAENRYCQYKDLPLTSILSLFHSRDCRDKPLKKIKIADSGVPDFAYVMDVLTGNIEYCCSSVLGNRQSGLIRGSLHLKPAGNRGDCEFRIFQSTTDPNRLFSNLEFCVALVEFCLATPPSGLLTTDFFDWLSEIPQRIKYKYLFRFLRSQDKVTGLIPKKSTILRTLPKIKALRMVA